MTARIGIDALIGDSPELVLLYKTSPTFHMSVSMLAEYIPLIIAGLEREARNHDGRINASREGLVLGCGGIVDA